MHVIILTTKTHNPQDFPQGRTRRKEKKRFQIGALTRGCNLTFALSTLLRVIGNPQASIVTYTTILHNCSTENRTSQSKLKIISTSTQEVGISKIGSTNSFFQISDEGFEKIADSFEEWLTIRCEDARNAYTEMEWEEIWNGSKPFTSEEEAIVKERKKFQWQVIEFDENRNLKITIKNNSNIILPYLTIGMRATDPTGSGRIWESGFYINVSNIKPGQEGVIEHHIHQNLFTPINTEFFQVSDPLPDERDKYWEFQKLRTVEVRRATT